ncbi:ATP synthase F1 subunit gamma [bacterium]|jgi:F-type H+-transporting ATPase subunit gamma|nr:ATP synthase F1 subunit gamma [bacterium]MBT4122022.1 ATP synthase F1 subunit gamma [bacterium]MBT4335214.1 ATP synthase F1 subunit gamma [bacterium]MBT4495128.1 ATP synthase F1 subunit gamma [bacterium]MBT4764368.1 ATP synthase F1 subunit gamma [bacterium]
MPQATKEIQRRIKSIGNTKKVTKAMEMVAASKMRKAIANVLATRSYSNLAWDLVKTLASRTDSKYHPLLEKRAKVKKIGLVLITSNRGLCSGFNAAIINRSIKYITKNEDAEVELIVLGDKGKDFMSKKGHKIVAEFEKLDITTNITEITPLAKLLVDDFIEAKYDKVVLAYTDFISTLVQKPRVLELLPINSDNVDKDLGQVTGESEKDLEHKEFEYLFEPSPDEVLSELLPRLIEMQIYQAILESDASEHSARMVAMRGASDAASDMIDDLTLIFNKARQSSITSELADISGGRMAME